MEPPAFSLGLVHIILQRSIAGDWVIAADVAISGAGDWASTEQDRAGRNRMAKRSEYFIRFDSSTKLL